MKGIKLKGGLSIEELEDKMNSAKDTAQYKRWHAIYLIKTQGLTATEIGKIEGVFPGTIYRWARKYNQGAEALTLKGRGGRHRQLMSWEQEKALLKEPEEDANKGIIITGKIINNKASRKLGIEVHKKYAYALLHRHGWRKITPRPKHPKKNKEEQDRYKKTLKT